MIEEFQGEYRFLSNFWPAAVKGPSGLWYASVENAYQASKSLRLLDHQKIVAMSAGQSKRYARGVDLRKDWEDIKIDVMLGLVRQKFTNNTQLTEKLLSTGDEELIEGNHWGDCFWGVCKGKGSNHLGKILMQVRDELFTGINN
jgi:ribA/ribD-fused uncharacterized protein